MIVNYKTYTMKQLLSLLIALLFISTVFAQHPKRKKIKALKAAHITAELNLTRSEAEKFWPVYNASEEKHHQLRNESRQLRRKLKDDFNTISENEAKIILKKSIDLQNRMHQERNKLTSDLIQFLPAKKIILLKKAEEDFTRKLIQKFKDHRGRGKERDTPPSHNSRGPQ